MKKLLPILSIIMGSCMALSGIASFVLKGTSPELGPSVYYVAYLYPVFGLTAILWGIFRLRQKKDDTTVTPLPDSFDTTVSFGVRLTSQDYIRCNIALLYARHPQILILYPAGIIIGLLSPLFTSDRTYLIGTLVTCIVLPYLLYRGFTRGFKSSKALQQELLYTITRTNVNVTSETLSSQNSWTNMLRVLETKEFFFLFTSANVANIIPKHNLKSESDLLAFRAIIRSYPFPKKLLN